MAAYVPATPEQEAAAEAEFQDIRLTAQWFVCVCYSREVKEILTAALADYPRLLRQMQTGSRSWRELPENAVRALRSERQRVIEVGRQIDLENQKAGQ